MSPWRPALRMARRDLRRHQVRAVLTCLLVALPVLVATVAALVAHNDRWSHDLEAERLFYDGNAIVRVGGHTEVRVRDALQGWPRGTRGAEERDPDEVDVPALLPEGTAIGHLPFDTMTALGNGGEAWLLEVDLSSPLTDGLVEITEGRAPGSPDEVAMLHEAAAELGLLNDGQLKPDARFELAGGPTLDVVGIAEISNLLGGRTGLTLVAPPDSIAPETDQDEPPSYLVDLPALSRQQARALVEDLAAEGVALQTRDSVEHPEAWGLGHDNGGSLGVRPLLVGGLCILVGLIEVVLIVGAAFSVAARRQVRDLGLLATNGGAAPDVRRVLLAQGVLLGAVSSVVGAAAGVATFLLSADFIESHFLTTSLHGREVPWWIVVALAALGSVTSVVAALLPGWRMARLTPVDALAGRFPLQPGEARAHRPALVLVVGGVLVLTAGGFATAAAHRSYPNWLGASVLVAGLGLGILVVGIVWATPYVVRRAADLGRHLPLSGRYAFRDAGRHRFRSAAAVVALTITVAGAVLAGFGVVSAERTRASYDGYGPGVLSVSVCCGATDPARIATVKATLGELIQPEEIAVRSWLSVPGTEHSLTLGRVHDAVQVVDEASLRLLADVDDEALEVFRDGGVLTAHDNAVRGGEVKVRVDDGRGHGKKWTVLPGTHVRAVPGMTPYTQPTYVSPETAESLGMVPSSSELIVVNAAPVTDDDLDTLNIHGFWAQSNDHERAFAKALSYSGIGVAGLLAAIVVGIAVALAAAESRDDVATLAAVGAAPWTRRRFGAMHGLFLGIIGTALGVVVGVSAGLSFTQLDGLPGIDVPWTHLLGTVALVLPLSWLVGGLVTPSRFTLTRRTA